MALLDGRLHIQEAGVNAGQLLHGRDFTSRIVERWLRSSRLAAFTLAAVALAALAHTLIDVVGRFLDSSAALVFASIVGAASTPAAVLFWSFSHLPVPHSDGFWLARSVGGVGAWKDTVWPVNNQDHWDEQKRRMRHRIEPLVGYVGVGGKLKVTESPDGLIVQPSIGTFVWMALVSIGFVPFAAWAVYRRFGSLVGLVLVVAVGGLLEYWVIRFVTRLRRARITRDRIVVESMTGGRSRSGADIPLAVADSDVSGLVTELSVRLNLPIRTPIED